MTGLYGQVALDRPRNPLKTPPETAGTLVVFAGQIVLRRTPETTRIWGRADVAQLVEHLLGRAGTEGPLKCSEAAARLGICERTLRRYMQADRIRYHRLPGGHYRIPEDAIDEFWFAHDPSPRPARRAVPAVEPARRRHATRPSAGRRSRLGQESPEDYDLSPDALAELRAQFR
jgi:excisionase family DNA binding protein